MNADAGPSRRGIDAAAWLVLGTLTLLIVIFGALGFLTWQAHDSNLQRATDDARKAADQLALQSGWALSAGRIFLEDIREGRPPNIDLLPTGADWAVYDATGSAIEAGPPEDLPDTIAGWPALPQLEAGEDWLVAGHPKDGGAASSALVIARRLESNGMFAGVALLDLGRNYLQEVWETANLGDGSAVGFIRRDGYVAGRYPDLEAPLTLSGMPVLETLLAAETGSYASGRSPADNVARIVAFRHVGDLGIVTASVSQDRVLRSLWTAVTIVLALMLPIGVALLVGSLLTARLLRRTERHRAQLAEALDHNQVLFREIHHRVKNNLQAVSSLLQMQDLPAEIKAKMGHRIAAMAAVHEHIYRSDQFEVVSVADYLKTLIETVRASGSQDVTVDVDLEPVSIDRDHASPLGLILNEVLSNAYKHAFGAGGAGHIMVKLRRIEPNKGLLEVEDSGPGYDPTLPGKGIGRRLIAALTAQIGGTADYCTDGSSRFSLIFPIRE